MHLVFLVWGSEQLNLHMDVDKNCTWKDYQRSYLESSNCAKPDNYFKTPNIASLPKNTRIALAKWNGNTILQKERND